MVDHIVRLDIKPLMTYNDGKKRKTTLTSFEKVLAHKENGIVNEEDIKTQAKADRRKLQSTTDRKAGQAVETRTAKTLYADPVTGRAVTYEDVADTKKSQADKASGTGSVSAQSKTTTADSMKTTKYDSYFRRQPPNTEYPRVCSRRSQRQSLISMQRAFPVQERWASCS